MPNLVIDIVNYAVRICIIVLGVLIAGGFVMQVPGEEWYSTGTGALLIVFGAYRAALYYLGVRRRQDEVDAEGEEGETELETAEDTLDEPDWKRVKTTDVS